MLQTKNSVGLGETEVQSVGLGKIYVRRKYSFPVALRSRFNDGELVGKKEAARRGEEAMRNLRHYLKSRTRHLRPRLSGHELARQEALNDSMSAYRPASNLRLGAQLGPLSVINGRRCSPSQRWRAL